LDQEHDEGQATPGTHNIAHVPGPRRRSGCFPAEPYPPPRQIECIRKESRPQELSGRLGEEDLEGTCKAQALAGPAIQGVNDGAQLLGGDLGQIGALGQVLTQQAVGVLVGSPFPRVIGMGEVDGQIESAFQFDGTARAPYTSSTLSHLVWTGLALTSCTSCFWNWRTISRLIRVRVWRFEAGPSHETEWKKFWNVKIGNCARLYESV